MIKFGMYASLAGSVFLLVPVLSAFGSSQQSLNQKLDNAASSQLKMYESSQVLLPPVEIRSLSNPTLGATSTVSNIEVRDLLESLK